MKYLSTNELRTVQGEKVKGFGECLIANHLLRLGIKYEYEADYKHPTRTPEYRQYQPDFYLVDHDLYLEHWGVDRAGNTAPFVNKQKYLEGMTWKRKLHKQHGTILLESYHYEFTENCLLTALEEKLTLAGIKFQRRSATEMLQTLREFGELNNLTPLLTRLLRRYKNNLLCAAAMPHKNNENGRLSLSAKQALQIVEPIHEKYEALLQKNKHIDFDDMLGTAIKYVQEGQFCFALGVYHGR